MSAVEAIHRAVEFNPHVPKVKITRFIFDLGELKTVTQLNKYVR